MDAFASKKHVLFALRHAKYLPTPYEPEDANRMTLGYFCLSSLALLPCLSTSSNPDSSPSEAGETPRPSALDTMLRPIQRQGFIDWVYEQQVEEGGFRGSDSIAFASNASSSSETRIDPPNIIQSYTAVLILALLEDPLARLDRSALLSLISRCQNHDGSFSLFPASPEPGDPRSTYSAFAICSMLNDWSTIDVDNALRFLESCRRYEGGYAQRPHLEANAGPTYCTIASYHLCGRSSELPDQPALLRWLIQLQNVPQPPSPTSASENEPEDDSEDEDSHLPSLEDSAGFQGRPNKPLDACYSFWSLGALRLLLPDPADFSSLVNLECSTNWLLNCQHPIYGGIGREPDSMPDVYHTYLSLAAMSIGQPAKEEGGGGKGIELGLGELDVAWNVEKGVAERLREKIKRLQEEDESKQAR